MPPIRPNTRRVLATLCTGAALLVAREAAAQRDPRCERMAEEATADTTQPPPPSADSTFFIAQVDGRPELTNGPTILRTLAINYPRRLRDQHISGCAVVRVRVGTDGTVERGSTKVIFASEPEFGTAAKALTRSMRFRAAQRNGRPVAVWFALPVTFFIIDDNP